MSTHKTTVSNGYEVGKNLLEKPDANKTKKMKCGLVMPISEIDGVPASHWDEVRQIVMEALSDTPFHVVLVSDADDVGVIQKRIVQNIYDNDMVICDVSARNPNVMFELGLRLAFDKPAIIIKDDKTLYSFDTAPIEHLSYPRDLHYHTINLFKKKFRDKVLATYEAAKQPGHTTFLKHFGEFVVAKIDEKPVGKDEFILESLSELMAEVRQLRKASVQSRMFLSDGQATPSAFFSPIQEGRYPMSSYVAKRVAASASPVDFIQQASDPANDVHAELLRSYVLNHVNTPLNEPLLGQIRNEMLSELKRHAS